MSTFWLWPLPLVIASKSQTRHRLLELADIPFVVAQADVDERRLEEPLRAAGANGSQIALSLARAKALRISSERPSEIVLGADQTLSLDDQLFAKAPTRAAALDQLICLAGRTHALHSAIVLAASGEIIFEAVDQASLAMRPLSDAFLERYVAACGESILGSVGCYQAEGRGIHLFDDIRGHHSTILGLPMLPLLAFLRRAGYLMS